MTSEAAQTAVDEQMPLIEAVQRLVRGGWDEVESSLVTYGEPIAVEGTRSIVRCRSLRSDPLGTSRLKTLAQQLANQIVNYCIPRTETEKVGQLSPDRQMGLLRRLLARYDYPPYAEAKAIELVLEQAELFAKGEVG